MMLRLPFPPRVACLTLPLLVLVACAGENRGEDRADGGGDAAVGEDASPDTDQADLATTAPDAAQQAPAAIASRQAVTFSIFRNGSPLAYVLSESLYCDAFPIERREGDQWTKLGMGIGNPSTCGGSMDNWSASVSAKEVPSESSIELTWDARELVVYEEPCPDPLRPSDRRGALQPSSPGDYRATFCFTAEGGGGIGLPGSGVNPACPCWGQAVTVPFVLPDDGDVNVDVQAPADALP